MKIQIFKTDSLTFRQKIIILVLVVFFIVDIILLGLHFFKQNQSSVPLYFENAENLTQKTQSLNFSARKGKVNNGKYAYFAFSEEQIKNLSDFCNFYTSGGITVRLGIKKANAKKYELAFQNPLLCYIGYLYEEDFSKNGKPISRSDRILAGTDLRQFIKNGKGYFYADFGLALEKNLTKEKMPKGIVIFSEYPISVSDFTVQTARLGFDFSSSVPFMGVASNGGNFSYSNTISDFSGGTNVFPVENTRFSVMPKIELSFLQAEDYGTSENPLAVKINAGGELISVRQTKSVSSCVIQSATLNAPFSSFEIKENANLVLKMIMTSNEKTLIAKDSKVLSPLLTDPGLILSSKMQNWRTKDYELYSWAQFPNILIFDTLDYNVQSDFFRRIAFYVEKTGYRGKILTDEELGSMHGYNAHDYNSKSLASFFTAAQEYEGVLNEKEELLKQILLYNNVIIPSGYGFTEGDGAIISISRESASYLRQSLTSHEAWHGIFFTNEDFRNAVSAVFYTVDNNTMSFIKGFWQSQPSLGYDARDEYLMKNEFMAYIMQQPLSNVASYFVHCANRASVMNFIPELSAWVRETKGITFEDAGKVLDEYAFDNWGLACGRVALITKK